MFAATIATVENDAPGRETPSRVMTGRTVAGRAAIRTAKLALDVAGRDAFYER